MVAYKSIEVIIQGLFGLGFTSMILSYLVQRYEDVVIPVLSSMGMSMLGGQMFDSISYVCEWMLPVGLICMLIAAIVWAANWG